jgi:hypothetical protein
MIFYITPSISTLNYKVIDVRKKNIFKIYIRIDNIRNSNTHYVGYNDMIFTIFCTEN